MNLAHPQPNHDSPLFSPDDLARILGVCRRTVQRYVERGVLPQPIRLSERVARWPREAIEEAFRRRVAKTTDKE